MKYSLFFLKIFFLFISYVNGQSIVEIEKIRDKINSLQENNNVKNNLPNEDNVTIDTSIPTKVLIEQKDIIDYYQFELDKIKKIKEELDEISDTLNSLPYYGYDYFTLRDSVFFTDNNPITNNYILGSGDEVIITMWGDAELNTKKAINKNGTIFIDNVGQITLAGKSVIQAKRILKDSFSVKYSRLKSNNPSTFIDISIGKLNPINVYILGGANVPGSHLLYPNTNFLHAIIQSGGISKNGSLRKIKLIRNNKVFKEIDFYDYLSSGVIDKDLNLINNDVIYIPTELKRIAITGSVNNEGYFELKDGDDIEKLINHFSGYKSNFSGKVYLKTSRFNGTSVATEHRIINIKNEKLSTLENGDSLSFLASPFFTPYINVKGQVINPGKITLVDNMSIIDALELAGGINDKSFINTMDLKRAEFVSRNLNSRFSDVRIIDLERILSGDFSENYILQPFDEITIYPNENYLEIENIKITGEVIYPGSYTLIESSNSLNDLISRSGGFSNRAFQDGIKVYRDTSQIVWRNFNFNLFPGDSVYVPKKPGVVYVQGEIYNPGYIEFRKNLSLRSYIESAGGYTREADIKNVIVIYPNGNVKRKNFIFNPKIKEGSIIVVNEKTNNEPIDWISIATTTINLSTSIATILVLISQSQSSG